MIALMADDVEAVIPHWPEEYFRFDVVWELERGNCVQSIGKWIL